MCCAKVEVKEVSHCAISQPIRDISESTTNDHSISQGLEPARGTDQKHRQQDANGKRQSDKNKPRRFTQQSK